MCWTLFCVPRHFVVGALSIGLAIPAIAAGDNQFTGVAGWRMLDAKQLDAVRGGMDLSNGLNVSFGLEQSILINGEVVSRTVLNLQNLQQTIASQVEAARADVISTTSGISALVQAQVADKLRAAGLQTTPLTTVKHTPPSQAAQTQGVGGASSPVTHVSTDTLSQAIVAASEPGVTESSSPAASQSNGQLVTPLQTTNGTTSLPLSIVQNGAGNTVGSSSATGNPSSVTTVLQNTLDNQRIQVLTEVNASANSLKLLRAIDMAQSIREGVIGSLRR